MVSAGVLRKLTCCHPIVIQHAYQDPFQGTCSFQVSVGLGEWVGRKISSSVVRREGFFSAWQSRPLTTFSSDKEVMNLPGSPP